MRLAHVLGAAAVALLAGCGHAATPADGAVGSSIPLPAGTVVAEYEYGSGDLGNGHGTFLSLFDEQSGRHLRDLVHLDEGSAWDLAGSSRAADGSIVYALARGPHDAGHFGQNTGDPRSCGGSVYWLGAATGETRSLFTVGPDVTISEPAVSPDGASVAYLSQPCTAGTSSAQIVVVRDLATGHDRRISVTSVSARQISWSEDGTELVITVSSTEQPSGTRSSGYLVVPAGADGPQPRSALRLAPDDGCVAEAAAFVEAGAPAGHDIVVAEGCPDDVTAPARLVAVGDPGQDVRWRASTGLCPNGMTLARDPRGRLLVTSTATCGGAAAPVDVVQLWTGQHLREVGRYTNPAQFVHGAS